jgi:hypothetical protein
MGHSGLFRNSGDAGLSGLWLHCYLVVVVRQR